MFLRTAEKKREAIRAKEGKESEPVTPVEPPKQSLPVPEAPAIEAPTEQVSGVDAPTSEAVSAPSESAVAAPPQPADEVNRCRDLLVGFTS